MRSLLVTFVGILLVMHGGCRPPELMTDPELVTMTGRLSSGFMAIGGEHTGWELHGNDVRRLEVDITHAQPEAIRLDGQRVRITGRLIERRYLERGPTQVLMAQSIERAD